MRRCSITITAVLLLTAMQVHGAQAPSQAHRPENSICPITGRPVDPTLATVPITVEGKTHWIGFADATAAIYGKSDPIGTLHKLERREAEARRGDHDGRSSAPSSERAPTQPAR